MSGSGEVNRDDERQAAHQLWLRESGQRLPSEEVAAEIAVPPAAVRPLGRERDPQLEQAGESSEIKEQAQPGRAVGWFALAFAIGALFVWPLLLGLTAAALGYYAYRQGSRGLGVWSMTLGLLAAAAFLVFIPISYMIS